MISIITGDIINSKKTPPETWMKVLSGELHSIGSSPKQWEIYRGDSFQLEVSDPLQALSVAIKIKAAIKCIRKMDVRMSIGIGEKQYDTGQITQSNGTAFIYSGEKFELLKKEKQNLAIRSNWDTFDKEINMYLRLASIAMDNWTVNSAEIVKISLENPRLSQEELGRLLNIRQNAVSNRLKRAYYDEIMELDLIYRAKLREHI